MMFTSDKAKEFTVNLDELPDEAVKFKVSKGSVPTLASFSAECDSLIGLSEFGVIDVNLVKSNSTLAQNNLDGFKDLAHSSGCNGLNRYRTNLIFLFIVTLGHLLLILLLQQAWQPQILHFPKQQWPKLKAYIYYEPNIEVVQGRVVVEQITNVVQQSAPLEPKSVDEPLNLDAVKEVEVPLAEDKEQPEGIEDQEPNKGALHQISKPSLNLSQSTQGYFQRQRAQALDDLMIEESIRYTRKRSLSEMDGEMIILELPEHDIWAETRTFDSELDPNRIVKQGSTCYRVVKTPNPINPHAENLGYPFRCDGKSLVSDLQKAIAARAEKMGIRR
ncbi:hypothetical protein HWQ46_06990 [Shewanella sp. D64]|uniref:hypothetical protein n=1 Tax=unclassified Shewanella TaxID=196818 RepID=UPI0022BA2E3C|nr:MULTISPECIES: hypothetical protein [unclassified Shewanella]MEC4725290.1 hypothetical protein [Shewanella sp. D64]MEC4735864.1 hypothetical protein [Shewanella sp. E94]WBJ93166.1 hypothetical protein HWQ47_14490 [Shewanella sp. MTB7]